MTFTTFTERFATTDFDRLWDDPDAFAALLLFWKETLAAEPWFGAASWWVGGAEGAERKGGDVLIEPHGLYCGNPETWNWIRIRFTNRFLATGSLYYDARVLDGSIRDIPPDERQAAAHLRDFLKALSPNDMASERWRDLHALYRPLEVWIEGRKQDDIRLCITIDHRDDTVSDTLAFLRRASACNFEPDTCHGLADALMNDRYGTGWEETREPAWLSDLREGFRQKPKRTAPTHL